MPPLSLGQSFASLHDFKSALRAWAIEENWTPHILDSDSHRVRAGCRSSPQCPFRIRASYNAAKGEARVSKLDGQHDCTASLQSGSPAHQSIKRPEAGKLKFLLDAVPSLMSIRADTNVHDIIAAVEQKYGQKIPVRQAQKVKSGLVRRVKGPCRRCHRPGHTRRHCAQLDQDDALPATPRMRDDRLRKRRAASPGTAVEADNSMLVDDETIAVRPSDADQAESIDPSTVAAERSTQTPGKINQLLEEQIDPELSHAVTLDSSTPSNVRGVLSDSPAERGANHGVPDGPTQSPSEGNRGSNPVEAESVTRQRYIATRREAARLMEQAGQLMLQAAHLQAEAARMEASLGLLDPGIREP